MKTKNRYFTVLNDGITYSEMNGSMIAVIPADEKSDIVNHLLKSGECNCFMLREVKDVNIIRDFFKIFFPKMKVTVNSSSEVIIHTGITE